MTDPTLGSRLSPRERDVLRRIAMGDNQVEAAAALGVGYQTVKTHMRSARKRLGARNKAHAVAIAISKEARQELQQALWAVAGDDPVRQDMARNVLNPAKERITSPGGIAPGANPGDWFASDPSSGRDE